MQRAFPNSVNWLTSNFLQYIYAPEFWRYRPEIICGSQIHFEKQWSFKELSFSSFDGKASLRIAALPEMNSVYSCKAIQLLRAAADWKTVSLISATQAAFSASGIRRLQKCVKPEHEFIWRGEWSGAFLDIQINFLVRDKFFAFLLFQEDGEGRHRGETLCFQLSWRGESLRWG